MSVSREVIRRGNRTSCDLVIFVSLIMKLIVIIQFKIEAPEKRWEEDGHPPPIFFRGLFLPEYLKFWFRARSITEN